MNVFSGEKYDDVYIIIKNWVNEASNRVVGWPSSRTEGGSPQYYRRSLSAAGVGQDWRDRLLPHKWETEMFTTKYIHAYMGINTWNATQLPSASGAIGWKY